MKRKAPQTVTLVADIHGVCERTLLDPHAIEAGIAAGTFPGPVIQGARPRWSIAEVEHWISRRIDAGGEALRAKKAAELESPAMRALIEALAERLVDDYLEEIKK